MESAQLWVELPLICALSVSRRRAWPCQHWVLSPCIRSCIRSVPAGRSPILQSGLRPNFGSTVTGGARLIPRAANRDNPRGDPPLEAPPNI